MSGALPLGNLRTGPAGVSGSGRPGVREQPVEIVPVKRYWPGKAPAWAQADEASDRPSVAGAKPSAGADGGVERPRERFAGSIIASASDRMPPPPPPGAASDDAEEDEEDDDDIDMRRARARARARALEAEADAGGKDGAQAVGRGGLGAHGGEDSSSSYETDTGSDDEGDGVPAPAGRVLLKPVFVPKAARQTVLAQQAAEEAEEEAERRKIERLAERRKETLELVVESVRIEAEGAALGNDDGEMPDDADDEDDLEAYELWKLREIRRVKAERDRIEAAERERAELERRRGLTDAERLLEDEERVRASQAAKDGKGERKFMQKYYHKGAFFQAEDAKGNPMLGDIMKRDFGEATGADAGIDKSSLPKPMQVKKFGFRSQSKWTHLSAEDTTNREDLREARGAGRGRGDGGYAHSGRGSVGRGGFGGFGGRQDEFAKPSSKRPRT